MFVNVVVDFGGGLAVVRPHDASGVLDELSLICDRCGKEERVQRRAVEAFAGIGASGDGEQWRAAGLRLQPGERRGTVFGAHAAAQDDGIVARSPQCAASFSRCAVQLVRTRQFLPLASAAATSVMTWRVRASLAIRSR